MNSIASRCQASAPRRNPASDDGRQQLSGAEFTLPLHPRRVATLAPPFTRIDMIWRSDQLDDFVARSDAAGGPGSAGCDALWHDFQTDLSTAVDQSLDPFGAEYVAQQMAVYEELAGHGYAAAKDEMSFFDVERHIQAPNPYDHADPAGLAVHLQRLLRAFRLAAPRRGDTLIDMGCGWGLSSEVAAYLGLRVQAVDINPHFVALVNARAERGHREISATADSFETCTVDQPGDLLLFYECFHHAVHPWEVLARAAGNVTEGGRIIFAGEPINDIWWRHWGMRLDPLSVYCIRKYGWFESGWSMSFLTTMIQRAGLLSAVHMPTDPELGPVVIATKPPFAPLTGCQIGTMGLTTGCVVDGDFLILAGEGSLSVDLPAGTSRVLLTLTSFRSKPLRMLLRNRDNILYNGHQPSGDIVLVSETPDNRLELSFDVERWIPDQEIGNGDRRSIGIHLSSVALATD